MVGEPPRQEKEISNSLPLLQSSRSCGRSIKNLSMFAKSHSGLAPNFNTPESRLNSNMNRRQRDETCSIRVRISATTRRQISASFRASTSLGIVALAMSMVKPVVVGAGCVSGTKEFVMPNGPVQSRFHRSPHEPNYIVGASPPHSIRIEQGKLVGTDETPCSRATIGQRCGNPLALCMDLLPKRPH